MERSNFIKGKGFHGFFGLVFLNSPSLGAYPVVRNIAKFGCVFSYFYDSVAAYSNLNVGKPDLISFHSAIAAYSKLIEM